MVLRKPNLLDAFQASAPEGKRAPPGKPPASAAGPFAQASAPKLAMNRRSLGSQMASDRLVQFAVVVCLVGIGIAYYIGRTNTASSTQAADSTQGNGTVLRETHAGTPPNPDPAEANAKAAKLSTNEADKAFFDTNNRVTVRVAQYPNDEAGKKAALADRDYLRTEGYPAVQPLQLGRIIVLCVGAKPTKDELKKMLELVAKLPGPKGSRKIPFKDAYVDNISNLAARK